MIVAVAIVDRDASTPLVLAAQRSYPQDLAGMWEFPGGKVEPGEDPVLALRREIREELGVDIEILRPLRPDSGGDWLLPNGQDMRLWLARAIGTPRCGPGHLRLRWVGVDDLAALAWLEGDVQILAPLARAIARPFDDHRADGDPPETGPT